MIMRAILYATVLLMSLQGCSRDTINPNREELRLSVSIPGGSRVSLDNQYITWSDTDCITIYQLESGDMYDNKVGELQIDPESISTDWRSAEFASQTVTLNSGYKYIAVTRSSTLGSSDYVAFELNTNTYDYTLDIAPGADQDGDGDDTQLEQDLLLASQIFEASYIEDIPTLYFSIEESIIELNVCFESGSEYDVESVSITAESECFSRYIRLNRDGSFGLKEGEDASQSETSVTRTLSNATIGADYYKVLIPIRWSEQAEASGDFTITLHTSDGKSSSTTTSAKVLEVGTIYQKCLQMSDPI